MSYSFVYWQAALMCIIKAGKNVAEAPAYYTTIYVCSILREIKGSSAWLGEWSELGGIKNTDRLIM